MATSYVTPSQAGTRPEHKEGPIARNIEQYSAKLPSDLWLWAAFGSIGASLFYHARGDHKRANFIAHWAPTLLLLGVYNKLVKLMGSEGTAGGRIES